MNWKTAFVAAIASFFVFAGVTPAALAGEDAAWVYTKTVVVDAGNLVLRLDDEGHGYFENVGDKLFTYSKLEFKGDAPFAGMPATSHLAGNIDILPGKKLAMWGYPDHTGIASVLVPGTWALTEKIGFDEYKEYTFEVPSSNSNISNVELIKQKRDEAGSINTVSGGREIFSHKTTLTFKVSFTRPTGLYGTADASGFSKEGVLVGVQVDKDKVANSGSGDVYRGSNYSVPTGSLDAEVEVVVDGSLDNYPILVGAATVIYYQDGEVVYPASNSGQVGVQDFWLDNNTGEKPDALEVYASEKTYVDVLTKGNELGISIKCGNQVVTDGDTRNSKVDWVTKNSTGNVYRIPRTMWTEGCSYLEILKNVEEKYSNTFYRKTLDGKVVYGNERRVWSTHSDWKPLGVAPAYVEDIPEEEPVDEVPDDDEETTPSDDEETVPPDNDKPVVLEKKAKVLNFNIKGFKKGFKVRVNLKNSKGAYVRLVKFNKTLKVKDNKWSKALGLKKGKTSVVVRVGSKNIWRGNFKIR